MQVKVGSVILLQNQSETIIATIVQDNYDDVIVSKPLQLLWNIEKQTLYFSATVWLRATSDTLFHFPKATTKFLNAKEEVVKAYLNMIQPRPDEKSTDTHSEEDKK